MATPSSTHVWYARAVSELIREFRSDSASGLSASEVELRRTQYGENRLPEGSRESYTHIFFRQFASPLIYLLLVAACIIWFLGDSVDAFLVVFVLLTNAVVGTIQEGKAQNTLRALKQFIATQATVVRDGREVIVEDTDIVPGDIIIVTEGEKIPADARIIEAYSLRVSESALTGESLPIFKSPGDIVRPHLPVPEQTNMLFRGSTVAGGNARALVVATGSQTALGVLSAAIADIDTDIPLKKDIRDLSRIIIALVAVMSVFVFALGVAMGNDLAFMFLAVVSLAVSVVPEGLPIVLTLVLATGVWRMAKRNALVKRLQAVEGLGQARVIAVDKTGTLTTNEMVVRSALVGGEQFEITGHGYATDGAQIRRADARHGLRPIVPGDFGVLMRAGRIAAFCGGARVLYDDNEKMWRVSGDPTEAALVVFARKLGVEKEALESAYPRVAEEPFRYETRYHASLHAIDHKLFIAVAGAPEELMTRCTHIETRMGTAAMTSAHTSSLTQAIHGFSSHGKRVIGLAYREVAQGQKPNLLDLGNLVWVGMVGIADSLRPEVPEAMRRAAEAGIRVVMITGDHRVTAVAIAREAGIYHDGDRILTGDELRSMSDSGLDTVLAKTTVFARIVPEDKLRIVQAYRRRGEVVAMTGDGVNDAPSLVAADLGVAMGKIGTEVAKEASDIILLDDNFGSIVSAVEEGRSIYRTIKKVILYLFSTSVGQVIMIVGALAAGYPLPLSPAQILWMNLITDGVPVLALAVDPKERGLLQRPPHRLRLIDRALLRRIPLMAIVMAVGSLVVFRAYIPYDYAHASTMALTALAVFQWVNAWNCRSDRESIFGKQMFENKQLIFATVAVVVVHAAALYVPVLQRILGTVPLTFAEWMTVLAVGSTLGIVEEARKWFVRHATRRT